MPLSNRVWIASALCLTMGAAQPGSDVPADARQTIRAANEAWLPAMRRQDAAAVAEPYADSAVFVSSNGKTVIGPSGVAALMRERFAAARVLGGKLTQDALRKAGSLLYEWGHATIQIESHGDTTTSRARYVTVWKQDHTGHWRIWRNLSLPD